MESDRQAFEGVATLNLKLNKAPQLVDLKLTDHKLNGHFVHFHCIQLAINSLIELN